MCNKSLRGNSSFCGWQSTRPQVNLLHVLKVKVNIKVRITARVRVRIRITLAMGSSWCEAELSVNCRRLY